MMSSSSAAASGPRLCARSLETLLNDLVDYAGLFPPAGLSMERAVETYARHWASPYRWGMARFVCPMARVDEWSRAASRFLASVPPPDDQAPPEPWRLSVLIDGPLDRALDSIEAFNEAHEASNGSSHKHAHTALIDTIEMRVQSPEIIDDAVELLPEDLYPFFELPLDADFRGFATALAGTGFGAKIRTGGVKPEMFPSPEVVADFLLACAASEVPFKATAGLHHPVRASYPLTYEPGCASGTMHGFLNVFLGAALLRTLNLKREELIALLGETNPDNFRFQDDHVAWKDRRISTEQLAEARENFAICFGSCSFDDPVNDLKQLGWLR
ncbi:MAG: hypothetical protein ACK51N_05510 [bacterium]|jgi:hypothetical protein